MLLACLSVYAINGKTLFYYDSPAYVEQGGKILDRLGLTIGAPGGGSAGDGAQAEQDASVNGSRSAVYSAFVALLVRLGGLGLIPVANLALLTGAVLLTIRALKGAGVTEQPTGRLVSLPLIVACAGSLPFYVAFAMPDMLTGLLLLIIAVLTAFSATMTPWEIALAFGLGALAVMSHISHIAIAAVLVPVVAVVALTVGNRTWWLATGLVILMVIAGLGERAVFRVAAKSVAGAEVVYIPFLTARLIEDGPGLQYLGTHCPDPGLRTCALFDALSRSDDPMRLTASHIIFETKPELGSFKFLPAEDQAAVAREQYRFFFRVLVDQPLGTAMAILRNTATQAGMNSVEMTIPTDHILGNTQTGYAQLQDQFSHGRLSVDATWLPGIDRVQTLVYILSLVGLGVLLLLRLPGGSKTKGLAITLLLGIAANAFVCGAVSQPADRYGARDIWLLPFISTLLTLLFVFDRRQVSP